MTQQEQKQDLEKTENGRKQGLLLSRDATVSLDRDALVQDAERYRFLRSHPLQLHATDGYLGDWTWSPEHYDHGVDRHMERAARAANPTPRGRTA